MQGIFPTEYVNQKFVKAPEYLVVGLKRQTEASIRRQVGRRSRGAPACPLRPAPRRVCRRDSVRPPCPPPRTPAPHPARDTIAPHPGRNTIAQGADAAKATFSLLEALDARDTDGQGTAPQPAEEAPTGASEGAEEAAGDAEA